MRKALSSPTFRVSSKVHPKVRVSATDWVEDGWTLDETVELACALKSRGAAAIHVSTGGLSTAQKIPVGPGYQVPFAERIKAETGLTTIAVGLITEPRQAEGQLLLYPFERNGVEAILELNLGPRTQPYRCTILVSDITSRVRLENELRKARSISSTSH